MCSMNKTRPFLLINLLIKDSLKFILIAMSLETNTVIVTRVHCTMKKRSLEHIESVKVQLSQQSYTIWALLFEASLA